MVPVVALRHPPGLPPPVTVDVEPGQKVTIAGPVRPPAAKVAAARSIPTPSANDWKGSSKPGQRRRQLTDPQKGVIPAGGALNPPWVAWLMGFPIGWTACAPLETQSFQRWLHGHETLTEGLEVE